jgi:poly-gamma-glutamate capsule biosynthesis protein CapA/YwtB (metallophosphatase superfamily)
VWPSSSRWPETPCSDVSWRTDWPRPRPSRCFAPEIVEIVNEADLFILNLECCVSERGTRWSAPGKVFFFRAPASAAEALALIGVDCVSLANNHALDFGEDALQDTFDHLARVGIAWAGAGADVDLARAPAVLAAGAFRLGVLSLCDHPEDFAAGPGRPGVAFADLGRGVPDWVPAAVRSVEADAVLVTPHWGPNMVRSPVPHVRRDNFQTLAVLWERMSLRKADG